jgi:hypothetical protein
MCSMSATYNKAAVRRLCTSAASASCVSGTLSSLTALVYNHINQCSSSWCDAMAVHGYLQCRQSGNFCPAWNVVGLHKWTMQAIQIQMCITHHTHAGDGHRWPRKRNWHLPEECQRIVVSALAYLLTVCKPWVLKCYSQQFMIMVAPGWRKPLSDLIGAGTHMLRNNESLLRKPRWPTIDLTFAI